MTEKFVKYSLQFQRSGICLQENAFAAMLKNKKLSWLPSYGPEMRGGTANCHVIIDDDRLAAKLLHRPQAILVAMNKPSPDKFENTVSNGGYVFIDTSLMGRRVEREDVNEICVNATRGLAHNIGNKGLANMVMLGAVLQRKRNCLQSMKLNTNEEIFCGKQA